MMHLKIIGSKDVKDLEVDLSGNATISATQILTQIQESLNVPLQNIQLINKGKSVTPMQILKKDDKLLVKIKREFIETTEEEDRVPCETSDCNFFGTKVTDNLCSVCFKNKSKKRKIEEPVNKEVNQSSDIQTTNEIDLNEIHRNMTQASRCTECNKKVGLLGFVCNCGGVYCAFHRHLEQHKCTFDHKTKNSILLQKSLTKVEKNKIQSI